MTLQFLPWSRRGLAAELSAVDDGSTLPAHAGFDVTVSVNDSPTVAHITTMGPGDVTGLDTSQISRTVPVRYATDVAPNEFAAIEFDQPDFPWLFTPARPDGQQRLRPWLALVVVTKTDGVSISVDRTKPLPLLTIEAPAVPADELPDLSQSWAWAHTQLITESIGDSPSSAIAGRPEQSLSRIVCPRRLVPSTQYFAALVPTFDIGVDAGLGLPVGDVDGDAGPAWTIPGDSITLPVYYHWEFTTGPAGDFESLARKLTPMAVPDGVGQTPMFIGASHRALPDLTPDAGGVVSLEGALRAPESGAGSQLGAQHNDYVDTLVDLVNETADAAAGNTTTTGEAVAPPIYGQWHVHAHQVPDRGRRPRWVRELNADPRHRATAGLGTAVVQENQEEYVDAAWSQVGEVNAANALLARVRAMALVAERLHLRHVAPIDPIRAIQLTAPAHFRLQLDNATMATTLRKAATLPGFTSRTMRRIASPRSPVLRSAIRRADLALAPDVKLAAASIDALVGAIDGALAPEISAIPDGLVATTATAVANNVSLAPEQATIVRDLSRQVDRLTLAEGRPARQLTPRANLAQTGLIGRQQIDLLRADTTLTSMRKLIVSLREAAAASDADTLALVLSGGKISPVTMGRDGGVLTDLGRGRVRLDMNGLMDRLTDGQGGGGTITGGVLGGRFDRIDERFADGRLGGGGRVGGGRVGGGRVGGGRVGGGRGGDSTMSNRNGPMPNGTFERLPLDRRRELIAAIPASEITGLLEAVAPQGVTPVPVDVPTARPTIINSFIGAVTKQLEFERNLLGTLPRPAEPDGLDLVAIRDDLVTRTAPRPVVAARLRERLRVGGVPIADRIAGRVELFQVEPVSPIMVGPVLDRPLYLDLARYNQERLLPGATKIPDNAITLVETNPRFVEAFMVGANHEFNRELLWRRYPTDRRGTAFRKFWDRFDGGDDVEPIHTWRNAAALGDNSAGDNDGSVVLLVRGQLLRRYPHTVVYAVDATSDHRIDTSAPIELPVFAGFLAPDITFVGFDFDVDAATTGNGKMFVLQEQPTEPRFGLDVPDGSERNQAPANWSDLSWGHVGADPGRFLNMDAFGGTPRKPLVEGGSVRATFGSDAGQLAAITFQRPFRAALHASEVLDA